jgi:hypothetical protein
VRARLYRVRYDIRRIGVRWADCYHIERNPRGTGFHAHLFQHGDYIEQSLLQTLCERRGMGFPYITAWRPTSIRAHGYALKEATGYGLKGAARSETLRDYLAMNGGRLVHASREFWRDASAERGVPPRPLSGVAAARRVYAERTYGPREAFSLADWKLERG